MLRRLISPRTGQHVRQVHIAVFIGAAEKDIFLHIDLHPSAYASAVTSKVKFIVSTLSNHVHRYIALGYDNAKTQSGKHLGTVARAEPVHLTLLFQYKLSTMAWVLCRLAMWVNRV